MLRPGRYLQCGILATLVCAMTAADAAFITIDDSDIATITITAGDFEEGFFVNGVLLTTGLGNSGSVTLADGGYSISGSWIDLGQADGLSVNVPFDLPPGSGLIFSGIEFDATSDGSLATLGGSFGGFTGVPYFSSGPPTFPQGTTQIFDLPFLSGTFISEVVPEPGTLTLLGLGLPVAGLLYRRRRAA